MADHSSHPSHESSQDSANLSNIHPSHDSTTPKNPFLSIGGLLWGFLAAIILGTLGTSLLWEGIHWATGNQELPPGFSSLITLLGIQGSMAAFAWSRLKGAGVNIQQMIGPFPPRYNWSGGVGWAIILITFTFSFMATIAYGAVTLFPNTLSKVMTDLLTVLAQETNPLWIDVGMAIMGTAVAPPVEEFAFRGLFFHFWSARRSIQTGLILTAILFASFHPQNFVGMFVFSVILSLLYLRTRNLWVPIGVHAIYNGIIFGGNLLALFTNSGTEQLESLSPEAMAIETVNEAIASISEARFGITSILFLLISSFFLIRFMYKNWPKSSAILPYFHNELNA